MKVQLETNIIHVSLPEAVPGLEAEGLVALEEEAADLVVQLVLLPIPPLLKQSYRRRRCRPRLLLPPRHEGQNAL